MIQEDILTEHDISCALTFRGLGLTGIGKDAMRMAQAKVYLSESLGSCLGFPYAFRDYGPWSEELEGYLRGNLKDLAHADLHGFRLSRIACGDIRRINALADGAPEKCGRVLWAECLAAVLYFYWEQRREYGGASVDGGKICALASGGTRHFTQGLCMRAFLALSVDGFFKDSIDAGREFGRETDDGDWERFI